MARKKSKQSKKSSSTSKGSRKKSAKSTGSKTETKRVTRKKQDKQKLPKKLQIKNIEKELEKREGWESNRAQTVISKAFTFTSFIAALAFVAKIAVHAEVLDHHPDIELSYGKVKVRLTTHKADSLTQLDLALADRIDSIKLKEAE